MAANVVKVSSVPKGHKLQPATPSDRAMSRRHHKESVKLAKMSVRYHKAHAADHMAGAKGALKDMKKHMKAMQKLAKG